MHGNDGPRWQGLAFGLVTILSFGLYTPVAKHWLQGISPVVSTGILYLSAGITLLVVLGLRRLVAGPANPDLRLRKADLPVLGLGVVLGCTASPLLLFGIANVSGMVGSLLCNLEGVFTVAIALLLGERLKRLELAGAAAILAGGVALSLNAEGGDSRLLGMVAVAVSCLLWALDSMTTRRLSGRDSLALMATKCMVAGTLTLGVSLAAGLPLPGRDGLVAAIVIGAAGWAASMVCFVLAMRHLGAAKVGSMLALSPFAGAIGSIVGLGERPTAAIVTAGALMALGAYWLAHGHLSQEAPAPPVPSPVGSGTM